VESGTIGLVKAMKTFDFSHGTAFSTYAVPLIFGEIRRFLRDDGLIKVSREEKRLSALLVNEREKRLALGEDVSISALAKAVGISVQDAASALFSGAAVRSLDEKAYDDDDTATLGSLIADDEEEGRNFDKLALHTAIENLSPDHRRLIFLRYFRDLSQTETAKILGLSQVKVSREEKKIMELLRKELS
jgi:RNA polymerase sporulation-specific sigma factor